MDPDQLLREALHLPPNVRAKIAAELIESLDAIDSDPGYDEVWGAEIRRRVASLDDGTATLVPAQQVLAEMRAIANGRLARS